MKTKNSNRSPRDSTQGLIRYCNYYLEFPDGDVWCDYVHIAGGFHSWIQRTVLWKTNPDAARKLVTNGEHHWKDNNGVLHRMVISETPVVKKWGKPGQVRRGTPMRSGK
jgi:hypothetical protein